MTFNASPFYLVNAGIRTALGTVVPPGGLVQAYVRSTGVQSGDNADVTSRLVTSLASAMTLCRSGMNDVIVVLPGHTESVSIANYFSSMVAGTRIIGLGTGNERPTFNWTAATSSWLLNVANVVIENCILNMAATASTTVAAPMTISAAGCYLVDCQIYAAASATQLSTIAITTASGATDCGMIRCRMTCGTSDGTGITTLVRLVAADRWRMYDCVLRGTTSSTTVGVLQMLTTASLDVDIARCHFYHGKAASACAFTGMAASTGRVADCHMGYLDNATLTWTNTGGSLQAFNCMIVNTIAENAAVGTVVSA